MVLKGHVRKGVIVVDERAELPEGAAVYISLEPIDEVFPNYRRYRGAPYRYEDPLAPAAPASDWDAAR